MKPKTELNADKRQSTRPSKSSSSEDVWKFIVPEFTGSEDHLYRIIKAGKRSIEVFGDREKAIRWLKSSRDSLGIQIPLELLDTSEGFELVINTLGRIECGIFS